MVVVLSGFNGIEHVIKEMYSGFDSDIKITTKKGKTFDRDVVSRDALLEISGVSNASYIIEETVILKTSEQNWVLGRMKGVDEHFIDMNEMDRFIDKGQPRLSTQGYPLAIMGSGLLRDLDAHVKSNGFQGLNVLAIVGNEKISKARNEAYKDSIIRDSVISIGAQFSANPKYDDSYFIVPIAFAADILMLKNQVTNIELSLDAKADVLKVKSDLQNLLGDSFLVEDKFDQNKLLFSTHKSEKWMTFLILCFIFLLATFNMIASLTMLVLDKKKDMATLHALGMNYKGIRSIFINEGLLINFIGAFFGLAIGLLICLGQQHFGWIEMGNKAVIDAFPIRIVWLDLLWIFATVLLVGVLTTYIPVRYLLREKQSD